eukprot:scpid54892/ scgid33512/ 
MVMKKLSKPINLIFRSSPGFLFLESASTGLLRKERRSYNPGEEIEYMHQTQQAKENQCSTECQSLQTELNLQAELHLDIVDSTWISSIATIVFISEMVRTVQHTTILYGMMVPVAIPLISTNGGNPRLSCVQLVTAHALSFSSFSIPC